MNQPHILEKFSSLRQLSHELWNILIRNIIQTLLQIPSIQILHDKIVILRQLINPASQNLHHIWMRNFNQLQLLLDSRQLRLVSVASN
ncbi:hypothetical protein WL21_05450 [Burkholderia ubonensis]|nr:hypothetical protein WJ81_20610 [Burkholderia ubonensis]KVZ67184.1 hypothetical protein WL20_08610 [Burkholderia ubonensis]KVZ72845.1 hypothetical protein WL21_05450 [Burkholderia ubonensis]